MSQALIELHLILCTILHCGKH